MNTSRAALLISIVWLPILAAEEPLRAVIDREIRQAWATRGLSPTEKSSDAEFLRRVSLDLIGVIPTYEEAIAFLDDAAPDKRERLIDRLLSDPRYAQHQADIWDLMLFTRNPPGSESDRREGFQKWLVRQFAENVPYDKLVQAILKAEGNSYDQGAPQFFVQYRNHPEDASEAISQMFLGVQLQCARCHDHPFETWTQLDFYGMAGFLARLQVVSVGKEKDQTKYMIAEKSTGDILFTGPAKEQEAGKKGEPVKPKFLLGKQLVEPDPPADFKEPKFEDNKVPPPPLFSRKDQLAEWITSPDNRMFARAIVNRIWAQYMGRGIVHPVDNMSDSNPASHPKLLEELAGQMVAHGFDLKWLTKELVNTEAYKLSSRRGGEEAMSGWHEYARVRPLSAEELADSWRVATWYDRVERKSENAKSRYYQLGRDYMLKFFGTPNSGTGDFQGGLQEHLYLNNGPLSSLLSEQKGNLIHWLVTSTDPVESRVERLYLATLSRRPSQEESQRIREYVDTKENPQRRWHDAAWACLTCSEFRFNH